MATSGVGGSHDLRAVGAALKAAGNGQLRKELLAGIRKAGKPVVVDVKAGGLATIPSRGGLARRVAGSGIGVRTRMSGKSAGVVIARTAKIYGGAASSLDTAGNFRHPVWGNKSAWVQQSAPGAKGWFTEEIADRADVFRDGIEEALQETAEKIARSV